MKSLSSVIVSLICVSIAESHVRRAASYSGSSAGSGSFAGSSGTGEYAGGSVSSGPTSGGGHFVSSSISSGPHPSSGGQGNYVGTSISSGSYPSGGVGGGFGGGGIGGGYGFGGGSFGGGGFGMGPGFAHQSAFLGPPPPDFSSIANSFQELFNRFQAEAQNFGAAHPSGANFVGASSSGIITPSGGFGSASVFPGADGGLNVRFGESAGAGPVNTVSGSIPPPSGGFYGISTFSTAGQSTVDGKTTSFKKSSVHVNDNGKVSTYTSHDP